jgi:hypothetical protein
MMGEDQFADWNADFKVAPNIKGDQDPGWEKLADSVKRAMTLMKPGTDAARTESDRLMLDALADQFKINLCDAGDPEMWHLGSLIRYREYVSRRWGGELTVSPGQIGDGEDDDLGAPASKDRLIGSVRRNHFAHLWWIAETVGERLSGDRPLCDLIFKPARSRLRLWLIDFEPFYGRPELASTTVKLCVDSNIVDGKSVDRFFKAMGAIAAVTEMDLFRDDPAKLFTLAKALRHQMN